MLGKLFKNPFKKTKQISANRDSIRASSTQKDILKSLFDLPIRNTWLSDDEIEKIMRDSTVVAACGSRKAATLKKEILITCEDKDIKTQLETAFNFEVLDAMLDIPIYGFGVFELNWEINKSLLIPQIKERHYKHFSLENEVLKFSYTGMNENIPDHKAVWATYKAKPNKPYGQPLLHTLFWLIEFKNASLQFWVELLERFGTPWVIAKTEGDKNALADEIYNMLGGDGAVIDSEDSLDIKTATDKGNFKELIEYIDDQIREIILGGNLTANVKTGSMAAANVHNSVREDLAQVDENIVNKLIKDIISSFKILNNLSIEVNGKLKDKDDPNKELVDRDKVIYDMGFQPTKEYIENTYSIKVNEIKNDNAKVIPNHTNISRANLLAMNNSIAIDELDRNVQNLDLEEITLTFQKQILEIINKSDSFEEMLDALFKAYPTFDTKLLEESLYKNLTLSQILAAAQIEDENPNG